MNKVKIGKIYRHFKGNYYFIQDVALDSETPALYIQLPKSNY